MAEGGPFLWVATWLTRTAAQLLMSWASDDLTTVAAVHTMRMSAVEASMLVDSSSATVVVSIGSRRGTDH